MASTTGAEIANAYVALTVKAPDMRKHIEEALGKVPVEKSGVTMGQKLTKGLKAAAKVGGAAVATVLGTALVKGFGRLKEIENAQAKLKGLGHDAGSVEKIMDNALASVKGTAFGLGEAATTAAGAVAAGIKPGEQLEEVLKTVANTAAASSTTMEEMGSIFNKVAATGKAYTGDISQLANRGIPIWQELSKTLGVSTDEVRKLASSGKIDFDMFAEAAKAAGGTVADEMGNTTTGAFDNMMAALGRLGAKILEDIFPLIGPLFKDVTAWLDEATEHVEPLVDAFGTHLKNALNWVKDHATEIKNVATAIGLMVAAYYTIQGVIAVINGVKAALAVARAVQLGWNAATYGGAAASYASTAAAKVGLIAHKAWNVVVGAGRILWNLMNGSLIKSAALWVANTAKLVAHRIAVVANNAGVSLWLKYVGMQIAAGWKSTVMWVKNTAAMVTQKAALVASTVATKAAAAGQRLLNLALKANPIGLVITAVAALVAGLIWFFTKTETGRKVWEKFTTFLGEAWENIKGFFQAAWDNVLEPVLTGIGDKFQWLWDWIIKPIVDFIVLYIKVWAAIFTWLWNNILKPIFAKIGDIFKWIWNKVISPVITWISEKLTYWGTVMRLMWELVIKPTLQRIGDKFKELYDRYVRPIIDWIKEKLDQMKLGFKLVWDAVKWAWDNVKNKIQTGWNAIKSVIDTLTRVIKKDPKEAFEAARDAIGRAWDGIKDIAKKPVVFVVRRVINDALIGTLNKLPGVNLKKVALPKGFATGGYTGNLPANAVAGVVHGNEHVIRADSRARIERSHPGLLDHMNRTGQVPGYKKGGMVHPLPNSRITTYWMGYPGHKGMDFAAPQGTPIRAAAAGAVNHAAYYGGWGNMVKIDHGKGMQTLYAHIMPGGFRVKVGDYVRPGQHIADVGTTGFSTGPHLHYEVWKNGTAVNPLPYVTGAKIIDGKAGGDWGAMLGLADWAKNKFAKAFPGGGMFVDAAGGVMREAVGQVVDWGKKKLSIGGATLYDNGGWLDPGTHLVQNKTRRPEPILTGSQWDALKSGRQGDVYVQNPFTGEYLLAKVDERAGKAVLTGLSGASQTALRMG